jgi:site-specific recombinase XerD
LHKTYDKTKSDAVFINHKAPYGEFKDTNGMHQILWKYMRVAGLEIPKNESCGLHSLRSSLARTMLEVGTPLPIISEVLGHESIQTTSIYLKINLEALRKCPIDPEEVFLHEQ